jgi:multicomponent Na+:H+ antiporter subunit B
MKSIILTTASKTLLPLLLLFSVFVLLRGHYLPGGGFIGGLIAAIAFILHAFANGLDRTRYLLRIHPGFLIPVGLLIAVGSAVAPMLFQDLPVMTGLWYPNEIPVIGKIGSALFFDAGVYIVVVGVTLTIIFTISEKA